METSQRYNSVPIKNNCALCLPTPYFWSPADPCCHGNEFWDKIDYNSALVKDNCALFAPTLLFLGLGCSMMSLKFLPCRLFWDKIDYNSSPVKDNC